MDRKPRKQQPLWQFALLTALAIVALLARGV